MVVPPGFTFHPFLLSNAAAADVLKGKGFVVDAPANNGFAGLFRLNDQIGLLRQLGYTLVPPGGGSPRARAAGGRRGWGNCGWTR